MPDPSEWRDALRTELGSVEARISELEWAKQRRTRIAAQLDDLREARRRDRERAIEALKTPVRRVPMCARVLEEPPLRPRHCAGCGVAVVDPRGMSAAEITQRLGSDRWLARADGLLAIDACRPVLSARRRKRLLFVIATLASIALVTLTLLLIGVIPEH